MSTFLKIIVVFPSPFLFYDYFVSQLKIIFLKHKIMVIILFILLLKMCMKCPLLKSDFLNVGSFKN